jgi:hypothetical protein
MIATADVVEIVWLIGDKPVWLFDRSIGPRRHFSSRRSPPQVLPCPRRGSDFWRNELLSGHKIDSVVASLDVYPPRDEMAATAIEKLARCRSESSKRRQQKLADR